MRPDSGHTNHIMSPAIVRTWSDAHNTDMRRLTTGYVLRNASLGHFVAVRTSYSVLTQTQTVQYSLLQICVA